MKKVKQIFILSLLIFFSFAFILNFETLKTRISPTVDPQSCPLNGSIKFEKISECKRRFWSGWMDSPFLIKARGKSSLCRNFFTSESNSNDKNACETTNSKRFAEVSCIENGIPSNYKCFLCDEYPMKVLLGFNEDCSQTVIYRSRGLNIKYSSTQIPLTFP